MRALRFVAIGVVAVLFSSMIVTDAEGRRGRRRSRSKAGVLEVKSTTDGAKVFVDGALRGTVPLAASIRLRPGRHTLKMTKPGFTQFLDVVVIRRRRTTTMDVDLLPVAGFFKITANVAKARVFIDGKFVGIAPMETEVDMGPRTVRIKKGGYVEAIIKKVARAGQTTAIDVELEAMAVGTTPYRPPPPPPPKWYEKWYVWAGAAGGLAAIAVAVAVPIALTSGNAIDDFSPDYRFQSR